MEGAWLMDGDVAYGGGVACWVLSMAAGLIKARLMGAWLKVGAWLTEGRGLLGIDGAGAYEGNTHGGVACGGGVA